MRCSNSQTYDSGAAKEWEQKLVEGKWFKLIQELGKRSLLQGSLRYTWRKEKNVWPRNETGRCNRVPKRGGKHYLEEAEQQRGRRVWVRRTSGARLCAANTSEGHEHATQFLATRIVGEKKKPQWKLIPIQIFENVGQTNENRWCKCFIYFGDWNDSLETLVRNCLIAFLVAASRVSKNSVQEATIAIPALSRGTLPWHGSAEMFTQGWGHRNQKMCQD